MHYNFEIICAYMLMSICVFDALTELGKAHEKRYKLSDDLPEELDNCV